MTPITEEFAGAVAAEYFGVTAPLRLLPGEYDRNFEVLPAQGDGAVLKFSHASSLDVQLEFENALMAHLDGLQVPRVLPNLKGETITHLPSGVRVRMLSRLPGRPLAEITPRAPQLLHDLGALLGRLDWRLRHFDHPGMHREWMWDLTRAADVIRRNLPAVGAPVQTAVTVALERFEKRAAPVLMNLPAQVIQNDANDFNVLVVPNDRAWDVSGLVDFGDALYAPPICEPAIASAYALLGSTDPFRAACEILNGYHLENPLGGAEIDVFWDLVVTRLAVSVSIAAGRAAAASGNDYHQVSARPAAQALVRLVRLDPDAAREAVRSALA